VSCPLPQSTLLRRLYLTRCGADWCLENNFYGFQSFVQWFWDSPATGKHEVDRRNGDSAGVFIPRDENEV